MLSGLLLLGACKSSDNQIVIEGELDHGGNKMIRLARIGETGPVMLDSLRMQDGRFTFVLKPTDAEEEQQLSYPMLYQLILSKDNGLTTMAQIGDHLSVTADADRLVQTYRVTGNQEAVWMASLDSALAVFVEKTQPLWNLYQQQMDNDSVREAVEQQYNMLVEQHTRFLHHFIQEHPADFASYMAFYQRYNRRCFFDEQQDFDILKALTDSLSARYPEHPYVMRMQQKVTLIEQQHDTD